MEWDFKDIYCGHREEGYRAYCHPDLFKPATTLVYHNDGNGKFTEVSKKVGIDKPSKGLGIAIADYDHDGWMDIFIANDSIPEFLFHNKGNGTFEEVGLASGERASTVAELLLRAWAWTLRTTIMTGGRTRGHRPGQSTVRAVPQRERRHVRLCEQSQAWPPLHCCIRHGECDSWITIMMVGRIFSSPSRT